MTTISATVRDDMDDTEAIVISLVENVQRADMNPMDKAKAFVAILSRYGDYTSELRERPGYL
jgi:ParB-like chromosome segregation protein Spo0J